MKKPFSSIEEVHEFEEIRALQRLGAHPNIVQLLEIVYDRNSQRLALVFELMSCNIFELLRRRRARLDAQQARSYVFQLLTALAYAHARGVFHRDVKPENILVAGTRLKVADFGSSRGVHARPPLTEYISTRWYRSPECLLSDGFYGREMDVFAAGCVVAEMLTLEPLFPGRDEADQLARIHAVLGTPPPQLLARIRAGTRRNPLGVAFPPAKGCGLRHALAGAPPLALDLVARMLRYDPAERISAAQALHHPYIRDLTFAREERLFVPRPVRSTRTRRRAVGP